jgi:hypothetical protein
VRDHWRELGFWRWWWGNRVPFVVKSLLALVALGALVAGGWFAAQKLPSANASNGASKTIVTTVERVVTVHAADRVVVKKVPVIQKVYVANNAGGPKTVTRTRTALATQTVVRTVAARQARPVTVTTLRARTITVRQTRTVTTKSPPVTTVQWKVITIVEKRPVTVTVTVTNPSP